MKKTLLSLMVLGFLVGCSKDTIKETVITDESQNEEISSVIPGEADIEFTEEMADMIEKSLSSGGIETKSDDLNNVLEKLNVISIERKFPDAGKFEARHREFGLNRWYRITYDKSIASTKAEDEISSVPGVVDIDFPHMKKSTSTSYYFNDSYYSIQWNISNDGSLGTKFTKGCDIDVEPVWENFTAGSSNVIVAVVDGGVDMDHEDLNGVVIAGGENGSRNFVKSNYTIVGDDHGSHVAGTIGAISNNNIGIAGIAGGKDGNGGVRILSCEIFEDDPKDEDNTLYGDESEAIVWAADHGAVICNNSWGYDYSSEEQAKNSTIPSSTKQAIDYFNKYAGIDESGNQTGPMKGGLVVFAAGNEGWQYAQPASYDGVIAVGAIGPYFNRTSYSNYGDWVDICAPGGDEEVDTRNYRGLIASLGNDNEYLYMAGTSMACPHVCGVAALLVSYFGGEGFTNEDLKNLLLGGANTSDISASEKIGGLVDAYKSFTLKKSDIAPDPVDDYTVSAKSNILSFNWKVTKDDDETKSLGYLVVAGKNEADVKSCMGSSSTDVIVKRVLTGSLNVGDAISTDIEDLDFVSKYYVKIISYDATGNMSESAIKSVSTEENNAPIITPEDGQDSHILKATGTGTYTYSVNDPDGHDFSIEANGGSNACTTTVNGNSVIFKITGKKVAAGTYSATIKATDEYGASTSRTMTYTILENHVPAIKKDMPNVLISGIGKTKTASFQDYFYDEDDDELIYTISFDKRNIVSSLATSTDLTLTSSTVGRTIATVTAMDGTGAKISQTFTVVVRDESTEIDLYPNPVIDCLNIATGEDTASTSIEITNATGKTVYKEDINSDVFSPAQVNMSNLSSGTYKVLVNYEGKKFNKTVIKK